MKVLDDSSNAMPLIECNDNAMQIIPRQQLVISS
jgi:hypothetical protein